MFLIFWTYFGYMGLLWILSRLWSHDNKKQTFLPEVTLVITAYNEESRIREKLENTLALSYPKDMLEIIVVSDGSTDKTEEYVRSFQDRGVQLLAIPDRHGKHYGQRRGWEAAKNDILVFTDATTFLAEDAVKKIVGNFDDPKIGCVSSADRMRSVDSEASSEGLYVKYEMKLRSLESKVCSLVGVSGSFFAVRKHLCYGWVDNMSADFFLPILTHIKGYRIILETEAVGHYEVLHEPTKEFTRKVRTVVHGLEVLFRFKEILNPFKYGFFSFQMLNHKLSRWLVPLYLIFLLWTNFLLIDQKCFYSIIFFAQLLFYLLGLLAFLFKSLEHIFIFRLPLFFIMVNYSIIVAWHHYLIGDKFVLWEPTRR